MSSVPLEENGSINSSVGSCGAKGKILVAVVNALTGGGIRCVSDAEVKIVGEEIEPKPTDHLGHCSFADVVPKDYTVAIDLKAKAERFDGTGLGPLTKSVLAGGTTQFTFTLKSLPSLEVVLFTDESKATKLLPCDVAVKLDATTVQKPTSDTTNDAALFPRLKAGTWEVKPVYTEVLARRFKPFREEVTLEASNTAHEPKRVEIVLVPVCKLVVKVERQDGTKLSAVVKITIAGPTPKTADLDPDTPSVTWDDVTPGKYTIKVGAQNQEANFRIGRTVSREDAELKVTPETGREPQVEVRREQVTTITITLAPQYRKVQFIGYYLHVGKYIGSDVRATFKRIDNTVEEADELAAMDDIVKRCSITVEAIKAAMALGEVDTAADVLKIFMLPEFYFRGRAGAYPVTTISNILPELQKETLKAAYKDWLFVFGTALGYLDQPRITAEHTISNLVVGAKMYVQVECPIASPVANPAVGWTLRYKPLNGPEQSLVIEGVTDESIASTTKKRLRLKVPATSFPANAALRIRDNSTFFATTGPVTLVADFKTIVVAFDCAGLVPTSPGSNLQQNGVNYSVAKVTSHGNDRYTCEVDIRLAGTIDPTVAAKILHVHRQGTEVFNVALVQKGGPTVPVSADGTTRLKEALVYKENISWIDFEGPNRADDTFWKSWGRTIEIHEQEVRAIPTEGSRDMHSRKRNKSQSEVNKSGVGGGSILTIDDVDLGIEVCLDHAKKKLANYYATTATAGEPKVQVHLIPSCGMSIKTPVAVTDGWVFNVDAWHCRARKQGATVNLVPAKVHPLPSPAVTMSDHFDTTKDIEDPMDELLPDVKTDYGRIVVYATGVLPARETV